MPFLLRAFFKLRDRISPAPKVSAHCDVPCGIYTPEAAKTAARTIIKMVEKISALPAVSLSNPPKENPSVQDRNVFVRMVWTKEEHARKCKEELLILWTDYFKPEHLDMFPNLHETFWKAAKLCSKNKQSVDAEAAQELSQAVEEIAAMFEKAEAAKKSP